MASTNLLPWTVMNPVVLKGLAARPADSEGACAVALFAAEGASTGGTAADAWAVAAFGSVAKRTVNTTNTTL